MDPQSPAPQPPKPPEPPPAPPAAALLRPVAPHVPLTPMMEFLQRRLEALEKDLAVERERANAASGLLSQQEALRSQVEQQLKAMTDTLRREKAERDSEQAKEHARGRIDALEKRLDEMHKSWVTLLREAMTQRESTHSQVSASQETIAKEQAALRQELTAVQGAINQLLEQMGQWRAETKPLADAAPALRAFQGEVAQMLSHFAAELRDRVAAWERRQSAEMEKHEDRLREFASEKAALLRELEERDHLLRQEALKERLHREAQVSEQVCEVARQMTELREEGRQSRAEVTRVCEKVTTPPAAKDKIIEGLEAEKAELLRALSERGQSLKAHAEERRQVEGTIAALNKDIDSLNARLQGFTAKLASLELDKARLSDELSGARRLALEKDERRAALEAERDSIVKALAAEARAKSDLIGERSQAEQASTAQRAQLKAQLDAETEARAKETSALFDLRGQLTTLSEHLARALQERDAAAARGSGWEKERADLLSRLADKENTISTLTATFQRLLRANQ